MPPTHSPPPPLPAPLPRLPRGGADPAADDLTAAIAAFQRDQAPLVREELARLAREGQRPARLFLACSDSRLVTSMITASRPGDAFTVRNVGNLVPPPPPPGSEPACDSVAAAIQYAVEVLRVRSITVCGHSGCGAMQALLAEAPPGRSVPTGEPSPRPLPEHPPEPPTPLARWLEHARPSLSRLADRCEPLAGRPVHDEVERLCLLNVVQQLEHLAAHPCVARAVAAGALALQGMYFHMTEAQGYLLDAAAGTFRPVRASPAASSEPPDHRSPCCAAAGRKGGG